MLVCVSVYVGVNHVLVCVGDLLCGAVDVFVCVYCCCSFVIVCYVWSCVVCAIYIVLSSFCLSMCSRACCFNCVCLCV